jgi:hypothetical protein
LGEVVRTGTWLLDKQLAAFFLTSTRLKAWNVLQMELPWIQGRSNNGVRYYKLSFILIITQTPCHANLRTRPNQQNNFGAPPAVDLGKQKMGLIIT